MHFQGYCIHLLFIPRMLMTENRYIFLTLFDELKIHIKTMKGRAIRGETGHQNALVEQQVLVHSS